LIGWRIMAFLMTKSRRERTASAATPTTWLPEERGLRLCQTRRAAASWISVYVAVYTGRVLSCLRLHPCGMSGSVAAPVRFRGTQTMGTSRKIAYHRSPSHPRLGAPFYDRRIPLALVFWTIAGAELAACGGADGTGVGAGNVGSQQVICSGFPGEPPSCFCPLDWTDPIYTTTGKCNSDQECNSGSRCVQPYCYNGNACPTGNYCSYLGVGTYVCAPLTSELDGSSPLGGNGGVSGSGGAIGTGGVTGTGGISGSGGLAQTGGVGGSDGTVGIGGEIGTGGSGAGGATRGTAGASGTGGIIGAGGSSGLSGAAGSGGPGGTGTRVRTSTITGTSTATSTTTSTGTSSSTETTTFASGSTGTPSSTATSRNTVVLPSPDAATQAQTLNR
jgi:hypothetical protein